MKIMAALTSPHHDEVTEKILRHLGGWTRRPATVLMTKASLPVSRSMNPASTRFEPSGWTQAMQPQSCKNQDSVVVLNPSMGQQCIENAFHEKVLKVNIGPTWRSAQAQEQALKISLLEELLEPTVG